MVGDPKLESKGEEGIRERVVGNLHVLSKRKKEKVNKTKIIIKININNKYK